MSDRNEKADRSRAEEYGWRVHGALDSWTGKVDTKASIALAIEAAVFGFVISLSEEHKRLADLHGAEQCFYRVGSSFILMSTLCALLVVAPQLNRRASSRDWRTNTIYFGHLRHWDPADLARTLRDRRTDEEQLARQLVAMSKIAWRKHALLQWSLGLLVAGTVCLLIAA